jgi:hypothetical protein
MTREGFFGGFYGVKSKETAKPQSATEVTVTSFSQPHVLKEKMEKVKMTHGQTVTATLSPVRLERTFGEMVLFFCPMQNIEISKIISQGDGGEIPASVTAQGLMLPAGYKGGLYKLKNISLSSNGTIQVKSIDKTLWEPYEIDFSDRDGLMSQRFYELIGTTHLQLLKLGAAQACADSK